VEVVDPQPEQEAAVAEVKATAMKPAPKGRTRK
jgi:hypothetical protein